MLDICLATSRLVKYPPLFTLVKNIELRALIDKLERAFTHVQFLDITCKFPYLPKMCWCLFLKRLKYCRIYINYAAHYHM